MNDLDARGRVCSALSSACREELIARNVAKIVEPPQRGHS